MMVDDKKEPVMVDEEDLNSQEDLDTTQDDVQNDALDGEENVEQEQSLSSLNEQIESLKQEKEETYNRLIRIQAEFDNFKKRTQKERAADFKYKSQDIIMNLLPVLDNFERALQVEVNDNNRGILDGISMVYRQFLDALEAEGVTVIDTVGEQFDPNLHHAVMQVEEEDKESNEIVEELQRGFMLKDRVIRPAMVKVNK